MADNKKMQALFMTFMLIIIGLALTPSVATSMTDAQYQQTTYSIPYGTPLTPASANTTTVTYNIRNTTFVVTLYDCSDNTTVTRYTEYNITSTAAKTFTWTGLVSGSTYWGTIEYPTIDLTSSAVISLLSIVPLIWVVVILAVGIAAIYIQLKGNG